jgi:threonine synthase
MTSYVSHLESGLDGARFDPGQLLTTHRDRPILVRYDLPAIARRVQPSTFSGRERSLWRYRELLPLPLDSEPVTLGEGMTPLLRCSRLGEEIGLPKLLIKDESQLPTGSFKSRGMTVAVSMARQLGVQCVALPTAGNAGGAAAAYAARAGIPCFVFMPADTPIVNQLEALLYGAKAFLVDGLIDDCGKLVKAGAAEKGWFDLSTLKEPYRLEGKKTMGLELAEQLDWRLPDAILYPTGGGTGLIGMWKAFQELRQLGWLKSDRLPRLYACQSDGCAPIVRAFERGERFASRFENAKTIARGLRVPAAVGDFLILDATRASGGRALAGREESIQHWMRQVSAAEGIGICPETAVCFDCLATLVRSGELMVNDEVLVFNTGAAQKYLEALPVELPKLSRTIEVTPETFVLPKEPRTK